MGPKLTAARPAVKVWLAVDMEACAEPTAEPTKQDQRTPIKMVSGRSWSTGIYQALTRLHILFSFLFWGDRNLEQDSCSY